MHATRRAFSPTSRGRHAGQPGQRGVYAIEFAVVFLFLFAALYAVLCYGTLVAVRIGMQNAAEEGARAGLRYQPTVAQRLTAAQNEASARLAWMKYPPVLNAQVCQVGATSVCSDGAALTQCRSNSTTTCQIVISVAYAPYADPARPWLPPLPNPLLPSAGGTTTFTLVGRASMLLDHRGS